MPATAAHPSLRPTPLTAVVQSALLLIARQAREAAVQLRVGSGISGTTVLADPVRLEQVLASLLTNALDAVAGRPERWIVIDAAALGGSVEIKIGRASCRQEGVSTCRSRGAPSH